MFHGTTRVVKPVRLKEFRCENNMRNAEPRNEIEKAQSNKITKSEEKRLKHIYLAFITN